MLPAKGCQCGLDAYGVEARKLPFADHDDGQRCEPYGQELAPSLWVLPKVLLDEWNGPSR